MFKHSPEYEPYCTLLVSQLMTPMVVSYIIPYVPHSKEFCLWLTHEAQHEQIVACLFVSASKKICFWKTMGKES